ncbi:MAG: hypothetical protein ACK54L_05660, partial [Betaproteobacteria bacterium]
GMLCLADRGFDGFERWRQAQATGAQLLWRCPSNRQLPVRQSLQVARRVSLHGVGVGHDRQPQT